ncbi:MAG: rhomboid family intramembrane serine protease [Bacteroidota bacterium]
MRFQLTPAVKNILIACVILFIGTLIFESKNISLIEILGLYYPGHPKFMPYQLITHMFMHGGLTHIIFNMFGLITFGVVLENIMGTKKFIALYFFSGLGAILIHLLAQAIVIHQYTGNWWLSDVTNFINSNPSQEVFDKVKSNYASLMIGASGCIYGVSAAFAFLFPNSPLYIMFIPVPIKAKYVIPGFIALDLFLGISNFNWDPTAHFAHVGGGLFGFALTYYWRKKDKSNFW